MAEPSQVVLAQVRDRVLGDLKPRTLVVHGKLGIASVGGAFLSLVLCGQFGVALTPMADSFGDLIHHHMDGWLCALTCGAIFAVAPVLLLRSLCHPMQFKVLVRDHKWPLVAWFLGLGVILASQGEHGRTIVEFLVWLGAAYLTFRLLAATAMRMSSLGGSFKTSPI